MAKLFGDIPTLAFILSHAISAFSCDSNHDNTLDIFAFLQLTNQNNPHDLAGFSRTDLFVAANRENTLERYQFAITQKSRLELE